MTPIDEFALKLINTNLERLNQDPASARGLDENQWREAVAWAQTMAEVVRDNPEKFIKWVGSTLAGR